MTDSAHPDPTGLAAASLRAVEGMEAAMGSSVQGGLAASAPLFVAVETDDAFGLRLLLERGLDIDARDDEGRTPAMIAALRGHSAVLRVLIEHGFDHDAEDGQGRSVMQYLDNFGCMSYDKQARFSSALALLMIEATTSLPDKDLKPLEDG